MGPSYSSAAGRNVRSASQVSVLVCTLNVRFSLVREDNENTGRVNSRVSGQERTTGSQRLRSDESSRTTHIQRCMIRLYSSYTHTMEMRVHAFRLGKGFLGTDATQKQGAASRKTPLYMYRDEE